MDIAIVLNQQSLTADIPTTFAQFQHHLSLLGSRSEAQRKESLAYLCNTFSTQPKLTVTYVPLEQLLHKVLPLLLDAGAGVRSQVATLMQLLPQRSISDQITSIMPFLRAALTHLSQGIRTSALTVLSWLLETAGNELVSSPGGWTKTLECCAMLLNWNAVVSQTSWTATKTKLRTDHKATTQAMQVVDHLLRIGLLESESEMMLGSSEAKNHFPLVDSRSHEQPRTSNAYRHLNLFNITVDDDSQALDDVHDRMTVFRSRFQASFIAGIEDARIQGGEIGRLAGQMRKVIELVATDL